VIDEFNDPAYVPHSPESRAIYSKIGYILLGKALEAMYNQSYEDVIQKLILDPVGMPKSTFVVSEDDGSAILPSSGAKERWTA
jgi:CubicO group peptidase (beta-lactamase class C family)